MKKLLFLALTALMLKACTVSQEYSFNEDYSGTFYGTIDMSSLVALTKMDSSQETDNSFDSLYQTVQQLKDSLSKVKGYSQVDAYWDAEAGIITIRYDFENLEVVNSGVFMGFDEFQKTKNNSKKSPPLFEAKGKSFFFDNSSLIVDEYVNDSSTTSMSSFFNYKLTLNFPNEVKGVNNDNFTLGEDGKSVNLEAPLFDIMGKEQNYKAKIKLK